MTSVFGQTQSLGNDPNTGSANLSPGGLLENVFDQYGNKYNLSEIQIQTNVATSTPLVPTTILTSMDCGHFRLHFERFCGFEDTLQSSNNERRAVLCQVFTDLSNFINSPLTLPANSLTKVNIWVRAMPTGSTALGKASSFYSLPANTDIMNNSNICDIADSEVWKTITLGADSYTNVTTYLDNMNPPPIGTNTNRNFHHGLLAINFASTFNWHTDLSTQPATTEFDLYSVALREAIQTLGFTSLIKKDGTSVFNLPYNYYSRYDRFLKTNTGTDLLSHNSSTCTTMYGYNFNSTVPLTAINPSACLNPPTTPANSTNCSTAINFVSTSSTVPVYTPNCFEPSGSLSYFEDQCITPSAPDNYFVMSNTNNTGNGSQKRFPKPEERATMCDIGYSTNTSFGENSTLDGQFNYTGAIVCDGITVAGMNDGIINNQFSFFGNTGTNIIISGAAILSNDRNAATFECLQEITNLNGPPPTIFIDSSNNITFNSSVRGVHLLRYVPVSATGIRGNITYIYVYVILPTCSIATSTPIGCELVNNGGFEINDGTNGSISGIEHSCGWFRSNQATPDYYHRNASGLGNNVGIPCNNFGFQDTSFVANNNAYAGLIFIPNFINGTQHYESVVTRLNSPLIAGITYQLSFDASLADSCRFNASNLQAYISPTFTPTANSGNINIPTSGIHFTSSIITDSNAWQTITFTFTANGGEEYLYIGGLQNPPIVQNNPAPSLPATTCTINPFTNPTSYYYIDNVSLKPQSPAPFTQIAPICSGNTLVLPTTSNSGVTGTWSPAPNNTTTTTYTFTPTYGQCATNATMTVVVNPNIVPTFTQVAPICSGATLAALPTTSNNGVTGIWSPTLNNTATTTYSFTPTAGQCAPTTTMTIVVNPITAVFTNLPAALCYGNAAPVLPTTSSNGITGTWTPAAISNTASGNYVFHPNSSCASNYTLHVNVLPTCGLFLDYSNVGCQITPRNDTNQPQSPVSIEDVACVRVCENSTVIYTLVGSTSTIANTQWTATGGIITTQNNTSVTINWGTFAFASFAADITLLDGSHIYVNKCVEKVIAPTAAFATLPSNPSETYCLNTNLCFDNLSTNNGGNSSVYYNWDFGDGDYSTEFEPCHTYSHSGTYTIKLRAFNGCNCFSVTDLTITITEDVAPISCPAVACENQAATYSIPNQYQSCTNQWVVTGGTISGLDHDLTVDVIWNHVDNSGFGTVQLLSDCFNCTSPIKIPVVKQQGTIIGAATLCPGNQSTYTLPQWPSTDFVWTINANGTGAVLYTTADRNKIIVQANSSGTINLDCTYTNSLLNCSGTAHYTINVLRIIQVSGTMSVCNNGGSYHYAIQDDNGNPVAVNYSISGPAGFVQTGLADNFDLVFPSNGIYSFSTTDGTICQGSNPIFISVFDPLTATPIIGDTIVCPDVQSIYSCTPPAGTSVVWSVSGNANIIGDNTGNTVQVGFDTASTTPYIITATYSNGLCSAVATSLTVNRVVPVMTIQGISTTCASSFETYSVPNSDADSYVWSIFPPTAGSIQTGQNTRQITVLWNTATTGQVKLSEQKCGALFNSIPYVVTILSSVAVPAVVPTTACTGIGNDVPVSLNIPAGVTVTAVNWDFGDNTPVVAGTSSNFSATHLYTDPLTTSVTYTITATIFTSGCISASIQTYQITVSPSPVVNITPEQTIDLCYSGNIASSYIYAVNLQNGLFSSANIDWFKNGVSMGINTPTVNVQNAPFGVGTYYAIVTNSFGCSKQTNSFTVTNNCPTGNGCYSQYIIDAVATNTACQEVTASITTLQGSPVSINWAYPNFNVPVTINPTTYQLQANNMEPGAYEAIVSATYNTSGIICSTEKHVNFIIPYKAGIKWQIACTTTANGYNVNLLDHSVYYPTTRPTLFEFNIDNNGWTQANTTTPIPQLSTFLTSGTHNIGIRISRAGYAACEHYETLVLPNFPSAAFTTQTSSICKNEAMQFHATTAPSQDLQFDWLFSDGSHNSQHDPVKIFPIAGSTNSTTLTVTNLLTNCSTSFSQTVNVLPSQNMEGGSLSANPATACDGSNIVITYIRDITTNDVMPTRFDWYKTVNGVQVFQGTTSSPIYPVTHAGHYFVYVQNSSGCWKYDTNAIAINFLKVPAPPRLNVPAETCFGGGFQASVVPIANTHFIWSINGVLQTAWNNSNSTSVYYYPPAVGNYSISVVAQTILPDGSMGCSGAPTTIVVRVHDQPQPPIIQIDNGNCEPYRVSLSVANPEAGAAYTWSNGDTGTHTTMTHDGPIKVTSTIYNCSASSQTKLPTDLVALSWIFPKGCYSMCAAQPLGVVLGPLGDFASWSWIENGSVFQSGNNAVTPLTFPTPVHDYQMKLNNGYCDITVGTMSVAATNCARCAFDYKVREIGCFYSEQKRQYAYQLVVDFDNTNTTPLSLALNPSSTQGYFDQPNIVLPVGNSQQTLIFYPQFGFHSGIVNTNVDGYANRETCNSTMTIDFPELCGENPLEGCEYKQTIGKIVCTTFNGNNAYQFVMDYNNPYATNLSLTYMVPNGEGVFVPNTTVLPTGISQQTFIFNPQYGFTGGTVLVMAYGSHNGVQCVYKFKIEFPELCGDNHLDACEYKQTVGKIICANYYGNNAYQFVMDYDNSYSTTLSLTYIVPNGEGVFVPNTAFLPTGISQQTFIFNPQNGFNGGTVLVMAYGSHNGVQCVYKFEIEFPALCGNNKPVANTERKTTTGLADNLLRLAPNPAFGNTTIYYTFVEADANKEMVLTDMLGRVLQTWQINDTKGTVIIDCSKLANGQYMVLMKENDGIIKNAKLLVE